MQVQVMLTEAQYQLLQQVLTVQETHLANLVTAQPHMAAVLARCGRCATKSTLHLSPPLAGSRKLAKSRSRRMAWLPLMQWP